MPAVRGLNIYAPLQVSFHTIFLCHVLLVLGCAACQYHEQWRVAHPRQDCCSLRSVKLRWQPEFWTDKEGRKESLRHPWQPTGLNGWNSVCSLLHSLCSTSCTDQTEEPCEPPARCSTNITSEAIIAGQGSVYAHNHCHKEQSSTQQDKPPSGRALEMLQARPSDR